MKPVISLCVASYNNDKYIERMLESVLVQEYPNLEVIVIDDGSTDLTDQLIQKYPNIIYIKKKNAGLSSSRQMALEKATGEYICFVDADDYLSNTYIRSLYESISKEGADVCLCSTLFLDEKGRVLQKESDEYSVKKEEVKKVNDIDICSSYTELLSKYLMSDSWNKMYRRDFLLRNNIKFNMPKGLNGSDLLFNHKVLFFCPKICTITSKEYYHVIYKSSAVHRHHKNLLQSYNITMSNLIKLEEVLSKDVKQQLKVLYIIFVRNALQDIYSERKVSKDKEFMLKQSFDEACKYYLNNFKVKNTTQLSKSLYFFYAILRNRSFLFLKVYLRIREIILK